MFTLRQEKNKTSVSNAQSNLIKILFNKVEMWVSRAYCEQVICLLHFIMIRQESLCLALRDWEVKICPCLAKVLWRPLLCLLHVSCWFLSWNILRPWIWRFLRNVGWFSTARTTLYPRRQNSWYYVHWDCNGNVQSLNKWKKKSCVHLPITLRIEECCR
jgi:hypothetical protein